MEVSSSTSRALRDAMHRLLTGRPERTDGRLAKANLAHEAQVGRATVHRAKTMLRGWDAAIDSARQPTGEQSVANAEIESLRGTLAARTNENARQQLEAAATVFTTRHRPTSANGRRWH